MDVSGNNLRPQGNAPKDPSPRFALVYPIAFFGGVLLLCAFILHGPRILAPFQWHPAEVEESAEHHP